MKTTGGVAINTDKIIAFDLLKDSKFGITSLAKTSTKTVHIQLRDFIQQLEQMCGKAFQAG